jgi:hypothetical protein
MGFRIDLTGQRFGEWEVIGFSHSTTSQSYWNCRCSCGAEKKVRGGALRRGKSTCCKSCSNSRNWENREDFHGMTHHPLHSTWDEMRRRCNYPNHLAYKHYGGRGISVCERWDWFPNFVEDMGERPEGMTLDRIDNDGNYEPDNCHWATDPEQSRNRRNTKIRLDQIPQIVERRNKGETFLSIAKDFDCARKTLSNAYYGAVK